MSISTVTISTSPLTPSEHKNMRAVCWRRTSQHHNSSSQSQPGQFEVYVPSSTHHQQGSAASSLTFTSHTTSCIFGIQRKSAKIERNFFCVSRPVSKSSSHMLFHSLLQSAAEVKGAKDKNRMPSFLAESHAPHRVQICSPGHLCLRFSAPWMMVQ